MLSKIVEQQRRDLATLKIKQPFEALNALLQKSSKDFLAALKVHKISYLFECKHRSPSEGTLRKDYPITALAKMYANEASALSVLTNQPYFGGKMADLQLVSETVNLPLLCKDIIIDPYQIALARAHNADAILLMLSVLDDDAYRLCQQYAHSLNMAVITEVYSENELIRAKKLNANIILVNHRDLNTMILDMNRIDKLLPLFPENAYIIAASGIQSYQDIKPLLRKVNAFLIGSSLSKSTHVQATINDLIYGPVKICGLTRVEDATLAYELGATYGGLIFTQSKRKISLKQALAFLPIPLKYIGVFANQSVIEVASFAHKLKLHAVQLHGEESEEYITELRKKLPPFCQIWKAVDGNQFIPLIMPNTINKLVVDNKQGLQLGGTGASFNWDNLKDHPLLNHMILSGGLSSLNIIQAKKYNTWGVDINSGVEITPGIKDRQKLTQLFQTMKQQGGQ